jgi:hypothetical protein
MTADVDIYVFEAQDVGAPLGSATDDVRDILRCLCERVRRALRRAERAT